MRSLHNVLSLIVSMILHGGILFAMAMFTYSLQQERTPVTIETVIAEEERIQQEFVQELDLNEEIATSINFVAGSMSTNIGGSEAPLAKKELTDPEELLKDPDVTVRIETQMLPGQDVLGHDLGETEVTGEIGAVVEGYGPALDRLTQELLRMMRSHQLLVVWLFDESESMKDDQEQIKKRIGRVYTELKLVEKQPNAVRPRRRTSGQAIMLTSITSYGKEFHPQTSQPTDDLDTIIQAIEKIPVDPSGLENTCMALNQAIGQHGKMAARNDRKLVLIVVSDESGDDGFENIEPVIHRCKTLRAPIYILGREAVFGSLYAYVRWRQPETGRIFLRPIRRGPETALAELLQFDGFGKRRDAHMSGFGPYDQVRLCRDTGGIFFQLPYEQTLLNDYRDSSYDPLELKQYVPDLSPRRQYIADRESSEFRKAIWETIVLLNPYEEGRDELLEVTIDDWLRLDPARHRPIVRRRIQQIVSIISALNVAQARLEKVRPLREQEPSLRWRANYDLITAQLYAYRVRLFQYGIALDQFAKNLRGLVKDSKSTHWAARAYAPKMIMPDEMQQQLLKVTPEEIEDAHQEALERFQFVRQSHPNTPWADRAEYELKRNFGVVFRERYFPPPPNRPNRKPRPKPTPPPNL